MIDLSLDNKKIHILSAESIKLSRENPYITTSGDYTLEVSIPMTILDNIKFFGPWNRIDLKKNTKIYKAKLYVNNQCVLNGSAKVTSITQDIVKLQLYGDRSEFNAIHGDKYIDELTLPYTKYFNYNRNTVSSGTFGGDGTTTTPTDPLALEDSEQGFDKFVFPSVYNESDDKIENIYTSVAMSDGTKVIANTHVAPMFNLLFVIKSVFKSIGYEFFPGSYDTQPYNHLIVASYIEGKKMSSTLPHWTLKEFVEQLQYFFSCTFLFSSKDKTVYMVPLNSAKVCKKVEINSENDFIIEFDDQTKIKSIGTSDLHYSMSDSASHDVDYVDETKIEQLPIKEYSSYSEMISAYNAMTAVERMQYFFRCPEGDYCQWIFEGSSDTSTKINSFIHVNQFGNLIRIKDDEDESQSNVLDLKIVPVAMNEAVPVPLFYEDLSGSSTWAKNPYGINTNHYILPSKDVCYQMMPTLIGESNAMNGEFAGGDIVLETTSIQDLIQGGVDESQVKSKPDRMELFFWDGEIQQATQYEFSGNVANVNAPAVFTAHDLKNLKNINHQKWSMTLNKDLDEVMTIGQLHNENLLVQTQKYCIKFVSKGIPSASDIFMIRNRRFSAEKIEIELIDGQVNPLMTGYFYEII